MAIYGIITYCLYYVKNNLYKFTKIQILYRNYASDKTRLDSHNSLKI